MLPPKLADIYPPPPGPTVALSLKSMGMLDCDTTPVRCLPDFLAASKSDDSTSRKQRRWAFRTLNDILQCTRLSEVGSAILNYSGDNRKTLNKFYSVHGFQRWASLI